MKRSYGCGPTRNINVNRLVEQLSRFSDRDSERALHNLIQYYKETSTSTATIASLMNSRPEIFEDADSFWVYIAELLAFKAQYTDIMVLWANAAAFYSTGTFAATPAAASGTVATLAAEKTAFSNWMVAGLAPGFRLGFITTDV